MKAFRLSNRVDVLVEGKGHARPLAPPQAGRRSLNRLSLFQLSILPEQPRKDAGDVALSSSPASASSSSTLTPTSAGFHDPSGSCPGTPSAQHGKLAVMQGVGCPSPVATLRRPTTLSRHASAAGQENTHTYTHTHTIVVLSLKEHNSSCH